MPEEINRWIEYWTTQVTLPQFWWQAAVVVLASLCAWFINHRLQQALELRTDDAAHGLRHMAVRSTQRLLWPISALVLVILGRTVLVTAGLSVVLLDVVVPILVALAIVRLIVYVLRKAFTVNPLLKSSENFVAMVVWIIVMLDLVGVLPEVLTMLDALGMQFGEFRISVLSIIKLLAMVAVAFTVALWISEIVNRQLRRTPGISPSMQVGVSKFGRVLLLTLAFLLSLNAVGIDLGSLAIFGGALGVGIGFGLQRIVSNFISGFILVMDRSIKPGDVITVGTQFGWVQELKSRYVVVRNRDGVDTLIPNENLIISEVINWSYVDRNVRIIISIHISYQDDPEQALALMLECAFASPRVLKDPEPLVRLMKFDERGMELQLRVWVADPENGFSAVQSDINLAIWRAFKEAGITVPPPQRDLHIRNLPAGTRLDYDGAPWGPEQKSAAKPSHFDGDME